MSELGQAKSTGELDLPVRLPSNTGGKTSLGVGLGGALIGSLCCLLPALALAAGFGGAVGLVQLGRYQPYLLAAGLIFVVGWHWYLVERRKSCCTTAGERRALYFRSVVSIVVFLLAYLAINYAVVPWLYALRSAGTPSM